MRKYGVSNQTKIQNDYVVRYAQKLLSTLQSRLFVYVTRTQTTQIPVH